MSALETLFFPFEMGDLRPLDFASVVFIGARAHAVLRHWPPGAVQSIQPFKPYADALAAAGFEVSAEEELHLGQADLALVLAPKNAREAQYWLALALKGLKAGGTLICAAENKAGGTRLKKMLTELGLDDIQDVSKNKARVCRGVSYGFPVCAADWLEGGGVQLVLGGAYRAQPGLFGWDKIDRGSALLLDCIPADMAGRGADYGCGTGYLARNVLERCPGVVALACIDADRRAVDCCRLNVADARASFHWEDLTADEPRLKGLDFIVMNPPFHEGKAESAAIGRAFIRNAHGALKPDGTLFMVANAHLPYEAALRGIFSEVEKLAEREGFKVFRGEK